MPLSENFPKDYLEKHKVGQPERVRALIVPGTVVKLPTGLTTTPKDKWFLIGCVEPLLLFIISTEIFERYRKRTTQALDYQLPVTKFDNACLDHDSYVDCWKFWEEYDLGMIVKLCCDGRGEILGTISEGTALAVVDRVCDCPTFSNPDKEAVNRSLIGLKNA